MSTATTLKRKSRPEAAQAEEHMKRANFFMEPSMLAALDKAKAQRGGSQAEHVRKAVGSYLKRLKIEA